MNKILLATATFALVVAAAPLYAQQVTTKDQLIGSWKVLSLKATTGDKVSYPLGEQVTGYVTVTPDRFWLLFVDATRKVPAAATLTDAEAVSADLALLAKDGRFHHLDGRGAGRPTGGVGYYVEGGAFYDAPNDPDEAKLTAGLKFAKKTATVMTYEQYFRREEVCTVCTTPLQKPFVYLCIPASRYVEYTSGILSSPTEAAFLVPRMSAWRRNAIKRQLTRMPDEEIIYRFQLSRVLPAGTDTASMIALNRTLYERARDMGGYRMTSSAVAMSQDDWKRHYGPAWQIVQAAKAKFDPKNVLTPGHGMFPS